jgi:hypothetical protein
VINHHIFDSSQPLKKHFAVPLFHDRRRMMRGAMDFTCDGPWLRTQQPGA